MARWTCKYLAGDLCDTWEITIQAWTMVDLFFWTKKEEGTKPQGDLWRHLTTSGRGLHLCCMSGAEEHFCCRIQSTPCCWRLPNTTSTDNLPGYWERDLSGVASAECWWTVVVLSSQGGWCGNVLCLNDYACSLGIHVRRVTVCV